MSSTVNAETATVIHQAGTRLVVAADNAAANLERWLVSYAHRAADAASHGHQRAAEPLAEIAEICGISDPPDGRNAAEVARFMLAVRQRMSREVLYVRPAYEAWSLLVSNTKLAVKGLGDGKVHVPSSSRSWSSPAKVELSDEDAQKVSDAARWVAKVAITDLQLLDRFIGRVGDQIDRQIEGDWVNPAHQYFGALSDVLNVDIPSMDAARLDAAAEWCHELSASLPNEYRVSIQLAAEAIDTLAADRSSAEHTCIDLRTLVGRSVI